MEICEFFPKLRTTLYDKYQTFSSLPWKCLQPLWGGLPPTFKTSFIEVAAEAVFHSLMLQLRLSRTSEFMRSLECIKVTPTSIKSADHFKNN